MKTSAERSGVRKIVGFEWILRLQRYNPGGAEIRCGVVVLQGRVCWFQSFWIKKAIGVIRGYVYLVP